MSRAQNRLGKYKYPFDRQMDSWTWSHENFWLKITKGNKNECWTWMGSSGPMGPLFGVRKLIAGKYQPQMTQARKILYYETYNKPLPNRQSVFHSCGNKQCMSPHHLTLDRPSRSVYKQYRGLQ